MAETKKSSSALSLSTIAPSWGSRKKRVRLGRGESSGAGKTCGRGGKGQKGRKGATIRPGFEGGQMPLYRRLPKLGFFSRKKTLGVNVFAIVSLSDITKAFGDNASVDFAALATKGYVKNGELVKVLSSCTDSAEKADSAVVAKGLKLKVHAVSASARKAIEAAGGTIELVSR